MPKNINMFDEYGKDMGLPSMKVFFEEKPYDGIEKIVNYLKAGKKTFVSLERAIDFFTKEVLPVDKSGMTDGEYSWSSSLYHYVEKYNLRLPKEFENKVLSR